MPSLYVVSSNGQISHFPILKDEISIGRSDDNDLVVRDKTVSRYHARITREGGEYRVTDLGSSNKIRYNGNATESALLKAGDKIQLGLTTLAFVSDSKSSTDIADNSVIVSAEDDTGDQGTDIIHSSSPEDLGDSRALLVSLGGKTGPEYTKPEPSTAETSYKPQTDLSALARSNKVLFVLYEISRQLNQIHDFDELLKKIMDLIFVVIDADYGFLVLTNGTHEDDPSPVVVKHRGDPDKPKPRIRASRTLINKVIQDKVALLTSNAMADSRLDGAKSVMIQRIRSAICVPLWRKDKIIGVIQLDSLRFDNQFTQDDLELLKAIGSQMAMIIEQAALNEQIREEERVRNRLERFHSPQVIEMILQGGKETKDDLMEPKELTSTILFTDIIGFTRISETLPPREVNLLLNKYFSRMTEIIFSYGGTLDKYIGDALMAVFGAPMEKEDDAERAVQAALEIRNSLSAMMESTSKDKQFDIRIGLNTGRVVAGNMGSPKRMEYTVIGDPVNIASRLETIAQPNQILIGEETFRLVQNRFRIQKVGPKKVKGKQAEIMVYEVLG